MKKRLSCLFLAFLMIMGTVSIPVTFAADSDEEIVYATDYASAENEDLTQYVNMRYGTGTSSECLIGPARPNGSVHPGPDTNPTNNYTGYYPNKPIRGFSQLHIQSGEGRFGQFLISPQVGLSVALDSHDSNAVNENPTATEYSVTLEKYGIDVSLTPTENAVIYNFTYPAGTDDASILLDMIHHVPVYNEANGGVYNKQAKDVDITIEQDKDGNTVLYGGAKYGAHGGSDRYYYFYAVIESASLENKTIGVYKQGKIVDGATSIDTPTNTVTDPNYQGTGAYLKFDLDESKETTFKMKIAVSFLNTEKAKTSLDAEIPAWDYNKVKADNNAIWNDKLDVIEVSGLTADQKEMFYTNLYDTFLQPRYRTGELAEYGDGMMLDDHVATWDTFRTLFPLLTITNPQLVTDQVESYLVRFADKEAGSADTVKAVKDIFTGYERTGTNQGGDNIDNVIAEAYVKGLIPEEMMDAVYELVEFEANMMRVDRNGDVQGTGSANSTYKDLGFIPADVYPKMNCNTQLEYCYNDYCLAQIALGEGDTELYNMLMERSASWLNIWNENAEGDKFTGWIWPKNSDGTFVEPNDSYNSATQFVGSWKNYFYEGTGYAYSFFVPHDIPTLIEKMGGEEEFIERLMIGIDKGYIVISNQPGYIQSFLFNYTSEPWHTSDYVDSLIRKYTINGTPGCEDSGASCAWYIFANVGFFPSAGQDIYWLTSPKYEQTTFNLDNGNTFVVKANNLSAENKYIQSVKLNGETLYSTMIKHSDIVNGGVLEFNMGSTPVNYASEVVSGGKTATGDYDWTIRDNGILTISGTGDGTLDFDTVITESTLENIPWYSVRECITSVTIAEATGITSVADYVFASLPNCTKIVLPSTLTSLDAKGIFAFDPMLNTIGVVGKSTVSSEFYLYEVASLGADIFKDSAIGLEITLILGKCNNFAPVKWFADSTTVNFDIEGFTSVDEWVKSYKSGTDTRAEGYKFAIGTVETTAKGEDYIENDNWFKWTLDTKTGILTFENPKTSWNELTFSNKFHAFTDWVVDWADEIEHIVIPQFNKISIKDGKNPFANLKNLKTVKTDTIRWMIPSGTKSLFSGCTSLTTFGTSSTFEQNKIKLGGISFENLYNVTPDFFTNCASITDVDFTGAKFWNGDGASTAFAWTITKNMFSGCTSLVNVNFADAAKIDTNAFKDCTALTSITIPQSITAIGDNAFAGCTNLKNVYLEATEFTSGLVTATSFPDADGLVIHCQNKKVQDAINALGYTKTIAYYEQYATGKETVGNAYSWSLDKETGILTFKNDKSGWNELSFTSTATAFATWVEDYKDEIKHIVIPSMSKLSISNDAKSPFAGLTNLETVKIDTIRWLLNNKSLFEGCTSLKTLGTTSTFEEGKIKLSGYQIENIWGAEAPALFKNCKAITSVDFTGFKAYHDAGNTAQDFNIRTETFLNCTSLTEVIFGNVKAVGVNAFSGCTALERITIPETLTTIADNAFSGCTALTSVIIEADSVSEGFMKSNSLPDKDGLIVYCNNGDVKYAFDKLGYTKTKAININALENGGIAMEGFSIRTEGYNGLRGIFTFENEAIALNEANGLTLVEYGTILASEANKNTYGTELTFNGTDHVTNSEKIIKKAVYQNGRFVGSVLERNATSTKYAITVVKYSDNYQTNVCMLGYSIWQDAAGKIYYFYADSDNDSFDATSIYAVTLGMYKAGVVNAANDPDSVIWDTLVNGGAVTLNAGTDYNNSDIYYEANGTTAKSFGNTFLAVDVPCVNQSVSGSTFTCTNLGSTYSLFEDGDGYVIIFRAGTSGADPKSLPRPAGAGWSAVKHLQYSSSFASGAAKIVNAPNPVFTSTAANKITYAVIDDGITTIPNTTFQSNKQIKTIVYPDTLSSIGTWAFSGSAVTTMFKAGDVAETGKIDFANYSGNLSTYALFYNAKSFKEVCLPTTITLLDGLAFNDVSVKKIWVAGTAEPMYDGIVDLTGAKISTGDSTFQNTKTINLIMLHDSATLHSTRTLDKMTSDGVTVWTKNYSESIDKEVQSIKNGTNANYTSGYRSVSYIYGDEALASYLATKYGS